MAGLLAWAADVVGGGGQSNGEEDDHGKSSGFPTTTILFTPEQQKYARELEQRASSIRRSIQDLRLRIPPPDISQRLPHIHAHSLASNAALALQLNAHSTTRHEVQQREVTLQEENAAYEKAISNCQKKMQEKLQEADVLQNRLEEMYLTEKSLRTELEKASPVAVQPTNLIDDSTTTRKAQEDKESLRDIVSEELDNKKKELNSMEELVQNLENTWAQIQHKAAKQPSPAQREKILEKQLQSLIEQLGAKQAQAEHLMAEIRVKERELDNLNGEWRKLENGSVEANISRTRFGRSSSSAGSASTDYIVDTHGRPYAGGRTENQQKLMLLRSSFVLYILALHVLVFIKISF